MSIAVMDNFNDHETPLASFIAGVLLGALVGAGLGFGVFGLMEHALLFPGDTVLAGAVICGTLGGLLGESSIQWLKEYWPWFW